MLALKGYPSGEASLQERLTRRTAQGGYEVSESALVLAIRDCQLTGDRVSRDYLCEVLLQRSTPEFERHSLGLRHRPDLREEAIANMGEHLLREALDPNEPFITQNFIHYLRCLCVDEFKRVLRQEGLRYRRDEDGHPLGHPAHVPRGLLEPLLHHPNDDEGEEEAKEDVPDQEDPFERLHAREEVQRILAWLPDQRDRSIVTLRAIAGLRWGDIAERMRMNERNVRLRYTKALERLREQIAGEQGSCA